MQRVVSGCVGQVSLKCEGFVEILTEGDRAA
jgi:hypothetical protein